MDVQNEAPTLTSLQVDVTNSQEDPLIIDVTAQ